MYCHLFMVHSVYVDDDNTVTVRVVRIQAGDSYIREGPPHFFLNRALLRLNPAVSLTHSNFKCNMWMLVRCACSRSPTTWSTGALTSCTSKRAVNTTITSSKRPCMRNCVKRLRASSSLKMKISSSSSRARPRRPPIQEAAIPDGSSVPGTYLKSHRLQRLLG